MKNVFAKLVVLLVGISCLMSCTKKDSEDLNSDPTKKTINCYAGGLSTLLSDAEKSTVKNLIITGSIDARDFVTMRNMSVIETIDLSTVSVAAYVGTKGTSSGGFNESYAANSIPKQAFSWDNVTGKTSLKSITLPNTTTSISANAFNCCGLTSLTIPSHVTSISYYAFWGCTNLRSIYLNMDMLWSIEDYYNCFSSSNYSSCTLYVSSGSVNSIKSCTPWKYFTNVKVK
jgi:hypothetical protein